METAKTAKGTYSQAVIEIADFLFENPQAKIAEVIAEYCGKLRKSKRTIEGYLKVAREYNKQRLNLREKTKEDILVEQAKKEAQNGSNKREKALSLLWEIAEGKSARKVGENMIVSTENDRIRALSLIGDYEGFKAPAKTAQTDSEGNDIITGVTVNIRKM
jgi:hypothetical protein